MPAILLPPIDSLKILTERSGQCFIAKNGKELYVSDPNGGVVLFTGPDFGKMSDDEISKWIVDQGIEMLHARTD